MTAEVASPLPVGPAGRARPGPAIRPVAGALGEGTPFYVPVGEVVAEENRVICHLCGRAFRSVAAHLAPQGLPVSGQPATWLRRHSAS